jgi:DNA-binding MarR family transcriptional regulator
MPTEGTAPKLKTEQIQALVVLMVEARKLTNADLKELAGVTLTGASNKHLEKLGWVETDRSRRTYAHTLTDKGWHAMREIHLMEPPAGAAARSLFTVLANLHRSLERLGISPGEFFKQTGSDDPESAIRAAYARLAKQPGDWVGLADLRDQLIDISRGTVDKTLKSMARMDDVRIIPVADAKNLRKRDRDAALQIGVEDNHVIAIGGQ